MPPVTRKRSAQDDGDEGLMDNGLPLATDGSTRDLTTAASKSFGANITTEHNTILQLDQEGRVHPMAGSRGRTPQTQLLTSSCGTALRTPPSAGGVSEDRASYSIGMAAAAEVQRLGASGSNQLRQGRELVARSSRGTPARTASSSSHYSQGLSSRPARSTSPPWHSTDRCSAAHSGFTHTSYNLQQLYYNVIQVWPDL